MPQPTEVEQFGSMQPAPLGTPHGYERTASLQGNKRLLWSPAAERIALEAHRVLTSQPERTSSGIGDKAPRAKYAAGESSEDAITMRFREAQNVPEKIPSKLKPLIAMPDFPEKLLSMVEKAAA
jgi:hypothetical protein